jgi:hypothetical protein
MSYPESTDNLLINRATSSLTMSTVIMDRTSVEPFTLELLLDDILSQILVYALQLPYGIHCKR